MGLDQTKETIYICDGDKSLWKIKQEHFLSSLGILDWTHISRNLHRALVIIEDEKKRKVKTKHLNMSYAPWQLKKIVKEAGLKVTGVTGFLSFPPLATNNMEMLSLKLRKKIAVLEEYLPFKQYYSYSVCILCKKE